MNLRVIKSILSLFALFSLAAFNSCSDDALYLHYAMKAAGENKKEIKSVLRYYRTVDVDSEKYIAAKYLIENMPAHYSYRDTAAINSYYIKALEIFDSKKEPDWQRDTLRKIGDTFYNDKIKEFVSDIEIISSDYLIYNIDRAFEEWRTRPWSKHLSFEEFRDWILPYKVTDLQSFDAWRDTLSKHYSDSINRVPESYFQHNGIDGAIEIVRNELHTKLSSIGHRIFWEDRGSIPMRSASTWVHMTYGSCLDYVTMGTAVFRSLGFPSAVDMVPAWGRNNDGHSWYVFLDDHGNEQPTINSLILPSGFQFYPYERIPKVWRNTYTINRNVVRYRNSAKYVYPFEVCQKDVTDHYNMTSDIVIKTEKEKIKRIIDHKYVYIAMVVNDGGPKWKVLDFGILKKGKAYFKKMGHNMLYIALGYDGDNLIPISCPFILQKNGKVDYLNMNISSNKKSIDLRRKYYESYNVVSMRRRILGGKIQSSDNMDFQHAETQLVIESTDIPNLLEINESSPHRYWRYLSPDGSWGSLSEISFYDEKGNKLAGLGIANSEAGQDAIERAYDGDLLSNFEINQPNGNWIGMDMGKPVYVKYVSLSPRGDDNDICPGNKYELFFFNGMKWYSLGYKIAIDNRLHYDYIPTNTLLWLHNYSRGKNERPFILKDDGEIEWW